jgi:hypothetical protein
MQPPSPDEYTLVTPTPPTMEAFSDAIKPASRSIGDLQYYIDLTKTEDDTKFFAALCIVGIAIVAISRMHRWKRPPVLELAAALTVASYFVMPENFAGQQVIASRQIGFGLWFAAAVFSPVPGSVTRLGRGFAIAAVSGLTIFHLSYWGALLASFHKEEADGFVAMMEAAPPRKRMQYVNLDPDSRYFNTKSFWHYDAWYMLYKQGQCDENPAFSVMQPIRYRSTYVPLRVDARSSSWPSTMMIWENFDLVLVHRWRPSAAELEKANEHGERIAQRGEWELWRSKLTK